MKGSVWRMLKGIRKQAWWVVTLALMLGLVAQYLVYRAEPRVGMLHATWRPVENFAQVMDLSTAAVVGEVIEVKQGPETVVPLQGLEGGADRIPHMDVRIRVTSAVEGSVGEGQEIVVRHVGGRMVELPQGPAPGSAAPPDAPGAVPPPGQEDKAKVDPNAPAPPPEAPRESPGAPATADVQIFVLPDDPMYSVGERYFLALEPRPGESQDAPGEANTYNVVHPAGRYVVNKDNSLTPVSDDPVSMSVGEYSLAEVEQAARGQLDIPTETIEALRRRVATGQQPGMPRTGHSHSSSNFEETAQTILLWSVGSVALMALGTLLVTRRRRAGN